MTTVDLPPAAVEAVARALEPDDELHEMTALPPGDPRRSALRDRVVEAHLPLVRYLAQRYRNLGEPLDDLVQVGTIGLIHAVDRYDPRRGTRFASFATPTILGEIKRHFRDRAWAVRVPRRLKELQLQITTARSELTQTLGRAPTVPELAEHLGIDQEVVIEAVEANLAYTTVSLEDPSETASMALVDTALEGVINRESLRPLLHRLPEREKRILVLRFFRGLTQSQIAHELGISQMHVSRLLTRTVTQLRQHLMSGG